MHSSISRPTRVWRSLLFSAALSLGPLTAQGGHAQQPQPAPALPTANAAAQAPAQPPAPATGTPARVVIDFYQALRARRFREAFALSIWRPAIDGLSAAEFEELRPEFEKMAAAVPERIDVNGEQISGDTATVFARVGDDPGAEITPIPLVQIGGVWTFGNREQQADVARYGKDFFPHARIEQHHTEVEAILLRLANAEAAYAAQHAGTYAELAALVASKPALREDVESGDTLGYVFHVTLGAGGKSYTINAEPLRYGRTGRLSYFMDTSGFKSKDMNGKPFKP